MKRALSSAAVLLLTACASKDPPPLLLTLPSSALQAAPAAAAVSPAATARTLVLRRVGLPEYLLSRRVRYRDSASSLADWPHTWWAERIEVGVTREMSQALRARLPGWTVCEGTCADGAPGDLVLHIEFQALDFVRGGAGGSARLQALALASASRGDATLWRAEQRATRDAADTPRAHANAIAEALQLVADAVASRVREIPPRTPNAMGTASRP
jgi:uncharacterized lipoprotein YmbA